MNVRGLSRERESARRTRPVHVLVVLGCNALFLPGVGEGAAEDGTAECVGCHAGSKRHKAARQIHLGELTRSVHAKTPCTGCHPDAKRIPHVPRPVRVTARRCGACHARAWREYAKGTHGKARAKASHEHAPTCTDCHGKHRILSSADEESSVSPRRVVWTCAKCHDDPVVLGKARLADSVVETYFDSYHGLVVQKGMTEAANCASCHGYHAVLPSSDPASPVHAGNLERTCGACHPDAEAFSGQKVHVGRSEKHRSWWSRYRVFCPIANRTLNPLVIMGLGALVGVLSGVFGVGGGFLLTPLLIVIGVPPAVAAATDSAQITAGGSSGAVAHYLHGNVDVKMGGIILAGGIAGGSVGVQVLRVLREMGEFDFILKVVYVIMLCVLGLLMLVEGIAALRRGRPAASASPEQVAQTRLTSVHAFFRRLPFQVHFEQAGIQTSALLPFFAGVLVGALAAFLGVGGGFIMIPVMIYLIGMPTHVAVGTSLFQITLVCANVTLQQAVTNHTVDLLLAVLLFAGSVLGAQAGVRLGQRLPGEQIRTLLGIMVLAVMFMLIHELVVEPEDLIALAKKAGGGH